MSRGIELRSIKVELRSDAPLKISGYAAVFNSEYRIGDDFVETIRPGAFTDCMGQDVRCLFNHNPSALLGRTESGTLHIAQDSKGLRYEADLPDCDIGHDVHRMVKRGDVSGSSFSFAVAEDDWSEGQREIISFKRVYDLGPVTFPAYAETTANARHLRHRHYASFGVCEDITDSREQERERLRLMVEIARRL